MAERVRQGLVSLSGVHHIIQVANTNVYEAGVGQHSIRPGKLQASSQNEEYKERSSV